MHSKCNWIEWNWKSCKWNSKTISTPSHSISFRWRPCVRVRARCGMLLHPFVIMWSIRHSSHSSDRYEQSNHSIGQNICPLRLGAATSAIRAQSTWQTIFVVLENTLDSYQTKLIKWGVQQISLTLKPSLAYHNTWSKFKKIEMLVINRRLKLPILLKQANLKLIVWSAQCWTVIVQVHKRRSLQSKVRRENSR